MPNPSPLSVVEEIYAAFGRGDIPGVLAKLHPEVDWGVNVDHLLPAAKRVAGYEPGQGHAYVGRYFGLVVQGYQINGFAPVALMAGGQEVAARIQVDFTVRSTGRRIAGVAIHHWIVGADGRVTRFRDFEDTLAWTEAWLDSSG
ncbi:MAG TPA: nuclear transport factor 2 family protein [Lacunisphaera sp.]|nr:nuclear transport factor 2 family protein [Lacunisphaera sp.]